MLREACTAGELHLWVRETNCWLDNNNNNNDNNDDNNNVFPLIQILFLDEARKWAGKW